MKNIEEIKTPSPLREEVCSGVDNFLDEEGEGKDHYAWIRRQLREKQSAGVDAHFGQINIDNLSKEALDIYRKLDKHQLTEKELSDFTAKLDRRSDEYTFGAMIRNWLIGQIVEDKEKDLKRAA